MKTVRRIMGLAALVTGPFFFSVVSFADEGASGEVEAGSTAESSAAETAQGQSVPNVADDDISRPRRFRLEEHRSNHFLWGDNNSKVQFSFKVPLFGWDWYLAYTQVMFWDIQKESSPFSDIRFNPETFYRFRFDSFLKALDVIPFAHESNGKQGFDSRGYDTSSVRFLFGSPLSSRLKLKWGLKLFVVYGFEPLNEDIQDFLGFWETAIALVYVDSSGVDRTSLAFRWLPGGRYSNMPHLGQQELDFRFRIGGQLGPALAFQIFRGFGESLLNYNQFAIQYRLGVSLSLP